MTPGIRPLVAGNWKMNGLKESGGVLKEIIAGYDAGLAERLELVVCPPVTLVLAFSAMAEGSQLGIGGQDCHPEPAGAHTGDISAEMLADAGARVVIVGHSERRQNHGENDDLVRRKAEAAWRAGLVPIVCVGETEAERQAGATLRRVADQLVNSLPDALPGELVVAYEPVWAIGTGVTPTPEDAGEVHAFIRRALGERFGKVGRSIRILYGGSVKPDNARELLAVENVDGGLIGGASLKAADFLGIAQAYLHMEG